MKKCTFLDSPCDKEAVIYDIPDAGPPSHTPFGEMYHAACYEHYLEAPNLWNDDLKRGTAAVIEPQWSIEILKHSL